jgi:hypothetical protein
MVTYIVIHNRRTHDNYCQRRPKYSTECSGFHGGKYVNNKVNRGVSTGSIPQAWIGFHSFRAFEPVLLPMPSMASGRPQYLCQGPHESALGVESLLSVREVVAEMVRGHCGPNPAPLVSKMRFGADAPHVGFDRGTGSQEGDTSCSQSWSRLGGHCAWRSSGTCTSAQRHSARP